jgi:hypothetical protein
MTSVFDLKDKLVIGTYYGTPFVGTCKEVRFFSGRGEMATVHVNLSPSIVHNGSERNSIAMTVHYVTGRDATEYRTCVFALPQ